MRFLKGFQKTASAAFVRHNDGTEFKIQDTDPAPYSAGAAQAAPSGIPTYQPTEAKKNSKITRKMMGTLIALGKMASSRVGGLDGVGSKSDAADTLATQLKWDTSSDEIPENFGYNRDEKKPPMRRTRKGARR